MSKVNVVIGAMAGIAVGALLGVLFAPEKGTETRKSITKKSKKTTNDLKDKFNEFVDNIVERFEKVQKEVPSEEENVEA